MTWLSSSPEYEMQVPTPTAPTATATGNHRGSPPHAVNTAVLLLPLPPPLPSPLSADPAAAATGPAAAAGCEHGCVAAGDGFGRRLWPCTLSGVSAGTPSPSTAISAYARAGGRGCQCGAAPPPGGVKLYTWSLRRGFLVRRGHVSAVFVRADTCQPANLRVRR